MSDTEDKFYMGDMVYFDDGKMRHATHEAKVEAIVVDRNGSYVPLDKGMIWELQKPQLSPMTKEEYQSLLDKRSKPI